MLNIKFSRMGTNFIIIVPPSTFPMTIKVVGVNNHMIMTYGATNMEV